MFFHNKTRATKQKHETTKATRWCELLRGCTERNSDNKDSFEDLNLSEADVEHSGCCVERSELDNHV